MLGSNVLTYEEVLNRTLVERSQVKGSDCIKQRPCWGLQDTRPPAGQVPNLGSGVPHQDPEKVAHLKYAQKSISRNSEQQHSTTHTPLIKGVAIRPLN